MPEQEKLDYLQRYLVEEAVEDYQEGHISRRTALKMIAGVMGSMMAAADFMAACTPEAGAPTAPAVPVSPTAIATEAVLTTSATLSPTPTPAAPRGVRVDPNDPSVKASDVQFAGAEGASLVGYLARPASDAAAPPVLVCHENRGLTDHIKDVARRLAVAGYVALAVDLLSRQGGTSKVADQASIPGLLGNMPRDQIVADFEAGLRYLQGQPGVIKDRPGMVGFCFGGGVTWLCATRIMALRAAVPFYGPNPPLENVPQIKAAVLAIYGGNDQRIDAGIPEIEKAMKVNGKVFEKIIYEGAAHAFHNDTGPNYNETAARDAWHKTLAWFERYLKG